MTLKGEIVKNYSKSASSLGGVFILSAVRTPVGLINGILKEFSAAQLSSFVIKEALQRAAVPPQDLESLFLSCVSNKNCQEEVLRRSELSKNTKITVSTSGMKSIFKAAEFLKLNRDKVVIANGMESFSNLSNDSFSFESHLKIKQEDSGKILKNDFKTLDKYLVDDYRNFLEARRTGAFNKEVFKIDFKKKGKHIVVTEDEVSTEGDLGLVSSLVPGDHAAALLMSTEEYFKKHGLVPLAEIMSFNELPSHSCDLSLATEKALNLAKCQPEDIARWEVFSVSDLINFVRYFKINSSQINRDGGILGFKHPLGTSGLMSICHLTHSLSLGELGCVAGCDHNGFASAVIVKKSGILKSNKPQLTLFTKHPCPLCEELKEDLKQFEGKFSLSEVDIEAKENEKYKELYKYEVPVLFLNGVFLCKHKLDVQDFLQKVLLSEKVEAHFGAELPALQWFSKNKYDFNEDLTKSEKLLLKFFVISSTDVSDFGLEIYTDHYHKPLISDF